MASDISFDGQYIWVSNKALAALVDFAIGVGREAAQSHEERAWVAGLADWQDKSWPGIQFELDKIFPTTQEKKFWAACFANVARRVFLRELGNQECTGWQARMIGDAYITSRLLTNAVRQVEKSSWHPETEDSEELKKWYSNLQLG